MRRFGPSLRLALLALLYYSCIFMVKASMFACAWSDKPTFGGLNFKTCLALAQTFGYAAGKVPSLLYSPKLPLVHVRGALVTVVMMAGGCVTLACVTPPALSLCLVWFACVWLAPTWSLLQRFLEGRQDTELIVSIVSFAYIGSAGLCKGAAADLVSAGFTDSEAVASCALVGAAVGALSACGVAAQPPPSADDIAKRGRRKQIVSYGTECRKLQANFGGGIVLVVLAYTALGALRAFRDYFQMELFASVGLDGAGASLFALSEFSVSIVVLASTACFGVVEDNRRAVDVILRVAAAGATGLALLTRLHEAGALGGLPWIIGVGASCFLAYVPLGTMLFDRLLAAAHEETTSALLNLAMDASVLVGTASMLVYKDFMQAEGEDDAAHMYEFFCASCWSCGFAIAAVIVLANWSLGRAVDRRRRHAKLGTTYSV